MAYLIYKWTLVIKCRTILQSTDTKKLVIWRSQGRLYESYSEGVTGDGERRDKGEEQGRGQEQEKRVRGGQTAPFIVPGTAVAR